MANKNLLESFGHAFDGFSHVLWTQRHFRVQLFMVMLVFLLSYVMKLDTMQVLFVLSAVTAVLTAELFNTSIEVVVNMITDRYHPLAKVAKDVAAAGVLIATIYAVLVGCAVFLNRLAIQEFLASTHTKLGATLTPPRAELVMIVLVGVVVLFLLVPLAKARAGHGSVLRGGAVSGHSAVAFLLCAAIVIASGFSPLPSLLALILAVLVAQSRVEGKIHTLREVTLGAAVAIVVTALLLVASRFG
jgi:diacylglycerol kinase (ATP)